MKIYDDDIFIVNIETIETAVLRIRRENPAIDYVTASRIAIIEESILLIIDLVDDYKKIR